MSRLDVENPLAAPEDAASEYLQSPAYRPTHPLTRSRCEMCRFPVHDAVRGATLDPSDRGGVASWWKGGPQGLTGGMVWAALPDHVGARPVAPGCFVVLEPGRRDAAGLGDAGGPPPPTLWTVRRALAGLGQYRWRHLGPAVRWTSGRRGDRDLGLADHVPTQPGVSAAIHLAADPVADAVVPCDVRPVDLSRDPTLTLRDSGHTGRTGRVGAVGLARSAASSRLAAGRAGLAGEKSGGTMSPCPWSTGGRGSARKHGLG